MRAATVIGRVVRWALHTEGSTRTSALIRIGLAIVLWARWGSGVAPWNPRFDVSWPWIAISASFYASTTLMLVGARSRFAAAWAGVTAFSLYFFANDLVGPGPWVHHHTYLLSSATVLCALTPCGRSYSVDRWFALRRREREGAPPPPEQGNLWGLRLLALQMSAVYLWSAYSKITPAYLSGARLEQIFMWHFSGSDPIDWPALPVFAMAAAWSTVAISVALGIGPFIARARPWVIALGVVLHAAYYVVLPVDVFSALVWVLYLAYFDADAVHDAIDRMSGGRPAPAAVPRPDVAAQTG